MWLSRWYGKVVSVRSDIADRDIFQRLTAATL